MRKKMIGIALLAVLLAGCSSNDPQSDNGATSQPVITVWATPSGNLRQNVISDIQAILPGWDESHIISNARDACDGLTDGITDKDIKATVVRWSSETRNIHPTSEQAKAVLKVIKDSGMCVRTTRPDEP